MLSREMNAKAEYGWHAAMQREEWLSRKMDGKGERWVVKQRDGWLRLIAKQRDKWPKQSMDGSNAERGVGE